MSNKTQTKFKFVGGTGLTTFFNQLLFKDGFYKQAASGLGFTFGEYT
jgi:hypothetical protein